MKTLILAIVCTALVAIVGQALATAPLPDEAASVTSAESARLTKNLVFHGIVEKFEDGTALNTGQGTFPLLGGDFDMIIGKKVNIIGKMVKESNIDKIAVSRVQFDQE